MKLIKTIAARLVMEEPIEHIVKASKANSITLFDVSGTISGVEEGTGQYGKWRALLGSFTAVRMRDKKEFRSGKLSVRGGVVDLLLADCSFNEAGNMLPTKMKYTLTVGVYKSNNKAGYEYWFELI